MSCITIFPIIIDNIQGTGIKPNPSWIWWWWRWRWWL